MNTSLTNSTDDEVKNAVLSMASSDILSLYIINFLLGLPLNIYVLVLLFRAGGLGGFVSFNVNQCFSEILFILLIPLFILTYMHMKNVYILNAVAFFIGTCMSARFLFQSSVCWERYLAVVHPITFLKYKSMYCRKMGSSFIWIYSIISGIVSCSFSNLPYTFVGIMYFIVLMTHVFLCFSILRVLRKPRPGERDRRENVAKKKAFELVSFSLLIFLMQNVPLSIIFGSKDKLSDNAFNHAINVGMDFHVAAGMMIPVLNLHQMGKLKFERCV